MRPRPLLHTVLLAALVVATATTVASASAVVLPGAPVATLAVCHNDATPATRSATFVGHMVQVPGGTEMAIRFVLYERQPGGVFAVVAAPGFGSWQLSAPGVGIYRYNEVVTGLPAPVTLRTAVDFRWYDAHRHVLRAAERVTRACVIGPPSANLALDPNVTIRKLSATTRGYRVVVRNAGSAPAGPFAVTLSVGTVALTPQTVTTLPAGGSVALHFQGPVCGAGATLTAVADPAGVVVEPANADRTRSVVCVA